MKSIIFTFVLLSTFIFNAYASSYPTNIEGTYDCKAKEIDSNELSIGVSILKKTGETYDLTSKFTDGSTYHGVGIYDKKTHVLAIGSINPKNENETGVSVAHIEKNGNVKSEWTYLNKTAIGHGTCIKRNNA